MGHKSSLGNFKKIEIISSIFSDQQHYEIRNKLQGKKRKKRKHMEAKQYITKQPRDHWRNQRGNQKIPRDKWQWKHDDPKPIGCSKSSSKREVYSNSILPQETRNISNKQSKLTPKGTRERKTNKTQS